MLAALVHMASSVERLPAKKSVVACENLSVNTGSTFHLSVAAVTFTVKRGAVVGALVAGSGTFPPGATTTTWNSAESDVNAASVAVTTTLKLPAYAGVLLGLLGLLLVVIGC